MDAAIQHCICHSESMAGAILLEQNDEWAVQRARHVTLETISQMSDDPRVSLPAVASRSSWPKLEKLGDPSRQLHLGKGHDVLRS